MKLEADLFESKKSAVKLNIHIYSYTFCSLFCSCCARVKLWAIMCLCSLNKHLPACRQYMCMYVSLFTAGSDLLTICEGLNNMQHAASPTAPLKQCCNTIQSRHIFWNCAQPCQATWHCLTKFGQQLAQYECYKGNLYAFFPSFCQFMDTFVLCFLC